MCSNRVTRRERTYWTVLTRTLMAVAMIVFLRSDARAQIVYGATRPPVLQEIANFSLPPGQTRVFDAGEAEAVLLISPVLADAFLPLLSQRPLANRHRLITYHKRGWRGSTHTEAPASVVDHANDAAALLAHLGVARAHIVGHSSGAAIALQLALMRPDMVHTISLLELSMLSVPGPAGFMQKASPAFDAYGRGDHRQAVSVFLSAVSGLEWDACRTLLDERIPGAITAAVDDAATFFGIELPGLSSWSFGPEQAAHISKPVLSVLGSDTEPLWVEIAELLRSWFPQLENAAIEGAGHLLQIQQPEAVARALAAFFQRHQQE